MTMEHRNGRRISLDLQVSLAVGSRQIGRYRIRNIGTGGLAVEGAVACLSADSVVSLSIVIPLEGKQQVHLCKALVIHQHDEFTGFMWIEEHTRILMHALLASQTPMAA
jgi:hypothetical protein